MTAEEFIKQDHISAEDYAENLYKITVADGYDLKSADGTTSTLMYCLKSADLEGYEVVKHVETANAVAVEIDQEAYEAKVDELIRERYSLSEELSLLRQQTTKADEYQAYYDFCEECKQTAKEVLQTEATAVEYEPIEDEQTDGADGE